MVEHVGNVQIDAYAQRLRDLLEPEGRLLNHGIARVRHGDPEAGPFSERYVFPDAAPLHVGRVHQRVRARRPAGRPHRGLPVRLRRDAAPLGDAPGREPRPSASSSPAPERVRIWRLYLRAARSGFTTGFTSIYQVRAAPAGVVLAPVGTESATVSA